MQDGEIILTIEDLEKIKKQERDNAVSETKGHYKMSDETRTAISDLKEFIGQGFGHVKEDMKELKDDNVKGHKDIIERQDKTNGNVKKNTEFRLMTEGQLKLIKVLLSVFSLGSLANFFVTFFKK